MAEDTDQRSLLHRIFTDPAHLLSVVRIPLGLLVWARPADVVFVAVIVVIAGLTDFLDGQLGRRLHAPAEGTANIGAWLDPVCDKFFVLSTATAIVVTHHVPLVVLALVLVRDVATLIATVALRLVVGAEAFHRYDFRARPTGKVTMAAQLLVLLAVVLWPPAVMPTAIVAGIMGVVTVAERMVLAWRNRPLRHPEPFPQE